jgi:hypothetical protein
METNGSAFLRLRARLATEIGVHWGATSWSDDIGRSHDALLLYLRLTPRAYSPPASAAIDAGRPS